jgi:2-phospho-L-lactate guanylyltransferase
VPELDGIVVVTSDKAAEAAAAGEGVRVLPDDGPPGHSEAGLVGIRHALSEGYGRVLLIAGDTPLVRPAELADLLADAPGVVIVPDRHGTGTNALLLAPPDVIEPSFGPDSRARHEQAAAAAGVPWTVDQVPTLLLDVDTADDLAALRQALAERRGGAAHTRGMLSRLAGRGRPPAAGT